MKGFPAAALALSVLIPVPSSADEVTVTMHLINDKGVGPAIGQILAHGTSAGVMFMPNLKGLPPGPHGFHVHEAADCGVKEKDGKMVAGLAAGGHFDPANTGKHLGPSGEGHLGDLPMLVVEPNGTAERTVTAGRLKIADLRGRSLMIHAEADNYGDKPGGARIACGVVNQ